MNTKGLRISDMKEGKCIPLSEILASIPQANKYYWALFWFDVIPIKKEGRVLTELQKKINESKNGFPYSFEALVELSRKIFQEIEVLIIGCSGKENMHRYNKDEKMYETCEFVIEMIDGGFWEVLRWSQVSRPKIAKIKLINSSFQNQFSSQLFQAT